MARALRQARVAGGLTVGLIPLAPDPAGLAQWRDLVGRALVENLFYEPDYVLAGARAFGAALSLLVVAEGPLDGAGGPQGARLLALWPCRVRYRWGVPLPVLEGFRHGFSIFGAPLIDRAQARPALAALLAAPRALGLPPRLLMPYLPLDGPLAALMDEALGRSGRRRDGDAHQRGFLDLAGRDAQARHGYLATQVSPSKSRQLARLARRMEAAAPVAFETLRAADQLGPALDDYLALELAGWKGRAGTAAGRKGGDEAFLRAIVSAYGAAGRVRIDRLRRDGHSLAASIGLRTPETFWYLKISYDEGEAKNSPGSQLVRQVTQTLLDDPTLGAADSCAPAGLTMIDGFWGDRRRLAHVLVEAGRDPAFPLAIRLETARNATAERARTLLGRIRNRRARA